MKNADTPAAPQTGFCGIDGDTWVSEEVGGIGLTKREHFAVMAMQALASGGLDPLYTAPRAIEYADALLAELERTDG